MRPLRALRSGVGPLVIAIIAIWAVTWLVTQLLVDPALGTTGTVLAGLALTVVAVAGYPSALRRPRREGVGTRVQQAGHGGDEAIAAIGRPLTYLRQGLTEESAARTADLVAPMFGAGAAVVIADADGVLAVSGPDAQPVEAWMSRRGSRPGGAVARPLHIGGEEVGRLAVCAGERTDPTQVEGVAHLLSLQLEVADLHRRAQVASDAKLDALRAQINPHFLFNTLNTIAHRARTDPEEARRLLVRLADFFRYAIRSQGQLAEFNQEYFFVRTYLALEQARFADRLRVNFDIDPQVLAIRVPALVIQPLVENAVKHGLGRADEGGTVTLRARLDPMARAATIEVRDDGVGMDAETLRTVLAGRRVDDGEGGGTGLANIHERLDHLFGDRYDFDVRSAPGRGTTVALRLPLG